jgi:hypothetical protein
LKKSQKKEPELSRHTWIRAATLALALPASMAAQAVQSYDLRVFAAAVDFPCCNPEAAAIKSNDFFNNGNPLAGPVYTGVAGSVSYSAVNAGFSAGSELTGADSDNFGAVGVGRLRFSAADATPTPSNLDAAGTASYSNRILLNSPSSGSLLNRNQSFEVATYWNFVTPDAGTTYGIRLSDNPLASVVVGSGPAFNDLIDLRVVRGNVGQPLVQLRRLAYDGNLLSVAQNFTLDPATVLLAGHTLADVKVISLQLHYNAGSSSTVGGLPYLLPTFYLIDAPNSTIGTGNFSQQLTLFNGEDFTQVSANTGFTVAVPEPATAASLLGGLLALGLLRQRQRRQTP